MKLNLLPVTVSKGAKSRSAWIVSSLMILGGVGGCIYMILSSADRLKTAKAAIEQPRTEAARAAATASEADTIIQLAAPFERNTALANAMITANNQYPQFYESLFRYIPPFFRIYSIRANPAGADNAQVTMNGTLTTYQQYADLMLALMRNPNVISVSRQGFVSDDMIVPALQPTDQTGKPRRPNEAPIPDDPLERLTYFQAQGAQTAQGYNPVGNFGTGTESTRFARPGDSQITVTLVMKGKLQVPNPTATLSGGGGGSAPGGGATPTGAPASAPAAPPAAGGAGADPGLKADGE